MSYLAQPMAFAGLAMSGEMQLPLPLALLYVACFGASTVMAGSEEVVPVAVCDIAVPLRPHSSAIDEMTARGSGAFMGIFPDFRNSKRYPEMHDSTFSIKRNLQSLAGFLLWRTKECEPDRRQQTI